MIKNFILAQNRQLLDQDNFDQESFNGSNQKEFCQIQLQIDYEELIEKKIYKDQKSNTIILLPTEDLDSQKSEKFWKTKIIYQINRKSKNDFRQFGIIIILVLIFSISLFRAILEVQIQYQIFTKNKEQIQIQNAQQVIRIQSSKNNEKTQKPNQKSVDKSPSLEPKSSESVVSIPLNCSLFINKTLQQKGRLYNFNVPYQNLIKNSKIDSFAENKVLKISKKKFFEAVQLLDIIHNIDNQGKLVLSDNPCEQLAIKRRRLQAAMIQQQKRFNHLYKIDQYHSKQLRICIVTNSFSNAQSGLIYRNIDSILQQNYTNYHVVYTDDFSPDQTGNKVKQYLKLRNVSQQKFKIIINQRKKGMMENIYYAITNQCKQKQIVVMVDGDDSLIGTNVLSLLNAIYQSEKIALMWSNFLLIADNKKAKLGFSQDYSEQQKLKGSFRKVKALLSSHLKTFFFELFKLIKVQDLKNQFHQFYGGASDVAIMIPMIELANPKIKYLPQILYEYRYDTGQSGSFVNKIPQKEAIFKIYSSEPYEQHTNFSFVNKAIEEALELKPENRKTVYKSLKRKNQQNSKLEQNENEKT